MEGRALARAITGEKMRLSTFAAALGVLIIATSGCEPVGPDALFEDTLALDRAFIPAWQLAQYGHAEAADSALTVLQERWHVFDAKHREFSGLYWESRLRSVSDLLEEAQSRLSEGDPAGTVAALVNGREQLLRARERIGMLYFPDALTRFSHALDSLGKPHKPFGDESFGSNLESASRYWQDVKLFAWDPQRYGLEAATVEVIERDIDVVDRRLSDLAKPTDPQVLRESVAAIRSAVNRVYAQFGNRTARTIRGDNAAGKLSDLKHRSVVFIELKRD